MANETPDLRSLLQTISQSKNWAERRDAIWQLGKLPPSECIVKALVVVLTDPTSDGDLREYALSGIGEQLKNHRDLHAPHELVEALDSPDLDRKGIITTLGMFRSFELRSVPVLLDKIRTDDELFVRLSHAFFDADRLVGLSDHKDHKIRSVALSRLWNATQDIDLCLPLYLRETGRSLPKETQDQIAAIEMKIDELQDKLNSLSTDDPARDGLEQMVMTLKYEPVMGEQSSFSFGQLGMALLTHRMTTDHPIACGQALSGLVGNQSEPEELRMRAALILSSIASSDEADRKMLVDAGVLDRIQELSMKGLKDDSLQSAINHCVTALKTQHDRFKTVTMPSNDDGGSRPSWTSTLLPFEESVEDRWKGEPPIWWNPSIPLPPPSPFPPPLPPQSLWPENRPLYGFPTDELPTINHSTSWDGRIDSSLAHHAPALGYIADQDGFETLWTSWKGVDSRSPEIDFDKYIAIVAAAPSSTLLLLSEVSGKGDLTVRIIANADQTSDHGFVIKLIERHGVKSVRGRAIPPKSRQQNEPQKD